MNNLNRSNTVKSFSDAAARLSQNPLGIIALFIVLIYGFAALLAAVPSSLTTTERIPLIYFLVIFPIIVLGLFGWIVIRYPGNLFSPRDFRNEDNYVALVASITAATVRHPNATSDQSGIDVRRISETVRALAPAAMAGSHSPRNRILWVDDLPENNAFERQAFEALGLSFSLALSTREALDLEEGSHFIAIISDMERKEGPQEGYVLLDMLRKQGNRTPFFIYASSNSAAYRREAAKHGAQGSTNDPQELMQMVIAAVLKASPAS